MQYRALVVVTLGTPAMGEARTAELWLKIDQLHLKFLQVSLTRNTKTG